MSNVQAIGEGVAIQGEPYQPLVEMLERILEDARAGRIVGGAFAGVDADCDGISGLWAVPAGAGIYTMGCSVTMLAKRYHEGAFG